MFDYEDLDLHECADYYEIGGWVTICDGDKLTADEQGE